MNHDDNKRDLLRRRQFLAQAAGVTAGGLLLGTGVMGSAATAGMPTRVLHHAPKARRVIWLFQSGGPSQQDLFDYKPMLNKRHGEELPDSIRKGQRLTGMSGNQSSLPIAGSPFKFEQHGECRTTLSQLLPYTAKVVDKLCVVRSMFTEAINHDPAMTFLQTGAEIAGRPSFGAWLSYGLGPGNPNLPASIAMVTKNKSGQPLYSRLWGAGFLPAKHQGVQFRSGKDAVLYLNDPEGLSRKQRRSMLDALVKLQKLDARRDGIDSSELDCTARYELAWRMQDSVPEAVDVSKEPDEVFELYGKDSRNPGTFAANCLLARRLAERDVRCIQLFHQGWDQHGSLKGGLTTQCRETDQPSAALLIDLERRGLLEDTLVIWGGEFGRTSYSQGKLTPNGFGRDHHPRCFSIWMAGAGIKGGLTFGSTDELGYNIVEDPMHVHDLHATILHLLGIDHERLIYMFQGRPFRLTDVGGRVFDEILS